jgi:hypothetical protein
MIEGLSFAEETVSNLETTITNIPPEERIEPPVATEPIVATTSLEPTVTHYEPTEKDLAISQTVSRFRYLLLSPNSLNNDSILGVKLSAGMDERTLGVTGIFDAAWRRLTDNERSTIQGKLTQAILTS